MAGQPAHGGYPPYNIEKTADDAWRIVMAVAGFTEAELSVTQKEDELLVTGKGHPDRQESAEYLYRGIGARDFERRFQLAERTQTEANAAPPAPPERPGYKVRWIPLYVWREDARSKGTALPIHKFEEDVRPGDRLLFMVPLDQFLH